ncbi:MAG: hypothetical protein IT281_04895 [Ignavibacteria bacterium]|nr:hypothetical protein [Ignavibacteria bacterium]
MNRYKKKLKNKSFQLEENSIELIKLSDAQQIFEEAWSEQRFNNGKIWSAIRTLLSQGGAIQQDYDAGKYKSFEEYNIRLDEAARERVRWLVGQII